MPGEPQARTETVRVLLMPPDIELSEITAAGMPEPKAEWTEAAKGHVAAALTEFLRERNAELVVYEEPENDPSKEHALTQLIKLHEAVGGAILTHKYQRLLDLPTKKDKFDWGLGNDVKLLRKEYDADYALFIFLRDSYSSPGRVALMIVVAALYLSPIQGGLQLGFASLVDLRTGDILWFNRLISETGDLRTLGPARKAVERLLFQLPL